MKSKKIAALMLSAMMIGSLAGCGSTDSTTQDDNTTTTESASTAETATTESAADTTSTVPERDAEATTAEVDQLADPESGDTIATLTIKDYGEVKIRLFPDAAPNAVENFVSLANDGYYDGLTFHRVISDFMIQGGDPDGNGTGGESTWGESFEDEINAYLIPLRGSLCMANSGGGDSNGSQFFITQTDAIDVSSEEEALSALNSYLSSYNSTADTGLEEYNEQAAKNYMETGGAIWLAGGYTVFGQVYDGMDIVDEISAVSTDSNDKPATDVIVESVVISTYE